MTFSKNSLTVSAASFLFNLLLSQAHAGELIHSYVAYSHGHYLLTLEMRIAAPAGRVYAVLINFNALAKVNDTIKLSRLLDSHGNQYTVLLESEACIWFYCRRVRQVQLITEMRNGYLQSITDPTQSDMVSGKALWHVRPDPQLAQQTLIIYSADFEPDFFVPPLIGPWLLKRRLLKESLKTVNGIQGQARHDHQ